MATHPCGNCGERDADLLVSLTATGDARFLCGPCLPGFVADYFAMNGLPGLTFGWPDDDQTATADGLAGDGDPAGPDGQEEQAAAAGQPAEPTARPARSKPRSAAARNRAGLRSIARAENPGEP